MNIFITRLHNGPIADHPELKECYEVAEGEGFIELPLYANSDMSISDFQLSKQFDGSFAGCTNGSCVIIPFPTGMGSRYDRYLVDEPRAFRNVKSILNIVDAGLLAESLKDEETVSIMNLADAVIVGNAEVKRVLDSKETIKLRRVYRESKRQESMETQYLILKAFYDAIVIVKNS